MVLFFLREWKTGCFVSETGRTGTSFVLLVEEFC